ncbi:MAG TPA: hypothetical protein VFX86_02430 [Candidatus Saccharimonadales bacterium]|nr:hypothetical protein [Candidatus Saccharimonadales bacterium]
MAKKTASAKEKRPRTRKERSYKSFRLSKKIKPAQKKPLPGIIRLCKLATIPFKKNKKLFLGIMSVYFILTAIFVSGISTLPGFVEVKDNIEQLIGGEITGIASTLTLFTYALSSSGGTGASSTNYQIFISLIVSLAVIWSIRQVLAGEKIGVRQAFYQGIYPLVPFLLVLFVIGLQLIPFLIGSFLLSTVLANQIAISAMEQALWWVVFILLSTLSFYMVVSSVFALYISTLPDMTPIKALRSARGLVPHRRFGIALRIAGLPMVLIVLYAFVLIPLIYIIPVLVIPAFLALNSFSIFFVHSYLYNLYRNLL